MTLDGFHYHALLSSAYLLLQRKRERVDRMNVFPVPDGDTGTNMCLTLSAVTAVTPQKALADTAQEVSVVTLREARGNSGAILSLFFRGIGKARCRLPYRW